MELLPIESTAGDLRLSSLSSCAILARVTSSSLSFSLSPDILTPSFSSSSLPLSEGEAAGTTFPRLDTGALENLL